MQRYWAANARVLVASLHDGPQACCDELQQCLRLSLGSDFCMISSCQLEYPHLTKRKLIITKSGIFTTSLALPDVESEVEMDPEVLVLVLSELLVLSLRVDAARLLLDNGAEVDRRCSRRRAKLRNHKRERALKDVYKVTPGISLV